MAEVNLGSNGEVTLDSVKALMKDFKDQKLLNAGHVNKVCDAVEKLLKAEKNVVEIKVNPDQRVHVVGNLAGQYYDMLHMFKIAGLPSQENPYVILGNFIDRGFFSVEVIVTLFVFKILYPNHVHLIRGNHESGAINKVYGLFNEMEAKYPKNPELYEKLNQVFCTLPLAGIVADDSKKVFVVHGGLCKQENLTVADIQAIDRFTECPIPPCVMQDLLWADPHPDQNGIHESPRGAGVMWGPDVTEQFLTRNGLDYIIRTHQLKQGGYEWDHNGKTLTVFSAPNYCDKCGNKAAFATLIGGDMQANITLTEAVDHPKATWEMEEPTYPPQSK